MRRADVLECEVLFAHCREIGGELYMLEPAFSGRVLLPDDGFTRKCLANGWLTLVGRACMFTEGEEEEKAMGTRKLPAEGRKSPRYGHLGMWNFCLGPASPIPGERLRVGIIDGEGNVVRRFEQIRGECTDPGYVDFFLSHKCRPAVHEMPIVDIGADGKIVKVLHPNYHQGLGQEPYLALVKAWAEEHGRPEWAL